MSDTTTQIISCVICTYRRPEMLGVAIESMRHQSMSPDIYEVIIVDNNSGDHTETVVENYQARCSFRIVYLLEVKQGLSYSRNAGIEQARGKYVAFLDDDAEADPEWLTVLTNVLETDQEICVVGGKILPKWDAIRPTWLTDELINNFSMLDLGESRKTLAWPEHVLGTSCFRKSVFEEVGKLAPQLGRTGDMLVGDEDTEIQKRIFALGKQIVYIPEAVVWHHVSPDRLNKRYIYKRAFGTGCSRAVLYCGQGGTGTIAWQFLRNLVGLLFYILALTWMAWHEGTRASRQNAQYLRNWVFYINHGYI